MKSKLILACFLTWLLAVPTSTPSWASQAPQIEVGFSPEGSAEHLIVKLIGAAKEDIKVMAYSFTSPVVVKALVAAKKRGVAVSLAADSSNGSSRSGRSALSTLQTAGIAVRLVDRFKILHDKIIVVDNLHVQTGSFNYSKAANAANSENVIVIWNAPPEVAKAFTRHWKSRWDMGEQFIAPY